jgi:PKD repeat protein
MSAWGENVVGSIDYDMIGYSVGNYEYDLTMRWNPASSDQGLYEVGANDRYNIGLKLDAAETTSGIPSDIQSFYNHGFPGVFGIEYDFSPYYHSTSDLVKFLNMTLVDKCTKLAVASLAEMARLMFTDLTVLPGDLTVSNTLPIVDEAVNVSVNITNTGNLNASDVEVVFYSAGEPFASKRNATMGIHNITVSVDPKNEIIEADETNNTAWTHVLANDRPKCVFTATPTKVFTSEAVKFNGTNSYDLFGGVVQYNFSFGDGYGTGWVNSSLVTHAYADDGLYSTSLVVKDGHGLESLPVNISIIVLNRPPLATPGSNVTITRTRSPIQFYANASDPDGVISVLWNFGDGSSSQSSDLNPIYSFNESGQYIVELLVEDDDGAFENYQLSININNRPHECMLNVTPSVGNITTEFLFGYEIFDMDSNEFLIYWDFGDGSTRPTVYNITLSDIHKMSYIPEFYHTYKKTGIYNVILTVKDNNGIEATANVTVTVLDLPPIAVAREIPSEVRTFENVNFNGIDSYDLEGAIFYHWSFGDGNGSSEMAPVHSFSTPGIYDISLRVIDTQGQTDTFYLPALIVNNRLPVAKFKSLGDFIESETIYFDASQSNDPEGSITYLWEFDLDKTSIVGPVTTNIFPKPGIYTVTLKVTDEHGDTSLVHEIIEIKASSDGSPSNGGDKPNGNDTKPVDNTTTKRDDEGESDSFVYILLVTNIIFIVLFIIFLVFSLIARGRRKDEEEFREQAPWPPPPLQDYPPSPPGPPGYPPDQGQVQVQIPPVIEPIPEQTVQYGNDQPEMAGTDQDYFAPLPQIQPQEQPQVESLPAYSEPAYQEPPMPPSQTGAPASTQAPPPEPIQNQPYQEYIPPPTPAGTKPKEPNI